MFGRLSSPDVKEPEEQRIGFMRKSDGWRRKNGNEELCLRIRNIKRDFGAKEGLKRLKMVGAK